MSDDKRARLKQWLASGEARLQPLSLPQRELWEATPVPVSDPANHICCLIYLRGRLTPENGVQALRRVVQRQEVLRLSILPGREGPLQLIRKEAEPALRFEELPSAEHDEAAVETRAQQIFDEPFDLLQGPLYRAVIMRRTAEEYVLAFALHHAIGDGWTLGVFVQDLGFAYAQILLGVDQEPLPPVPLTWSAWSASERAYWQPAEVEKRAAFWRTTLAGARRLWPSQPAAAPWALNRWVTAIPAELGTAIRALARREGATLFSTLLAAFQIALTRWSGVADLVVGTPVANRNKPAVRETMGYFAGIVPLRGQVDESRSFVGSLRLVHQATIDAFANAMPFAELVHLLGAAGSSPEHPIFDVRFALQNHPIPDVTLSSLTAKLRMRSTGTARFHLGCEITEEDEGLEAAWLSRRGFLPHDEVARLSHLFTAVLAAVCRAPESRLAALTT